MRVTHLACDWCGITITARDYLEVLDAETRKHDFDFCSMRCCSQLLKFQLADSPEENTHIGGQTGLEQLELDLGI